MRYTAIVLLAVVAVLTPLASHGQPVAPKPGVQMPQAYFDRVAQDPTAFQFQKAWIQKAERARAAREEYFREFPPPEGMTMASLPDAVRNRISVAGTVNVPVIAINYANVPAPFTAATVQNQIFTGPTTSDGTLTQLYSEMSYGAINLTGNVLGWVAGVSNDTFYEGGCNGLCGAAKTGQLVLEALNGVDGATNFGLYDNDGPDNVPNSGDDDGFVDFIAIVHPETGGECGGPNMWSHRWVVTGWPEFSGSPWTSNDPRSGGGFIQVFDYTIQPVKGSVTGCGAGINEIGVFAHEFGHAFGLPDLYDTNGGGQGVGEWALMGSGNWQNPPNPVHMCSHSKIRLGWLSSQWVGPSKQSYNIDYFEANQDVYRLDIVEEKFNVKTFQPLAGTASLHCGLPTSPAAARNWPGGSGYGNNWNERVCRDFNYDGSGTVTLKYDVAYQTEPGYDYGRVYIKVGAVETLLASYNGGPSTLTNQSINLNPYLGGAGPYQIIAEFTSDVAWSDEDGLFLSAATGPYKLDNVSVTGGGESYSTDFEVCEDGWYYKGPHQEYFLVENRNKAGVFDKYLHTEGLAIWHIEDNVYPVNTSGSTTTANLRPAGVTLECADGLNQLLLGVNRGDSGDGFPGSTNKTVFDNASNPNSKSYNNFATNVCVQNISAAATTMTADMSGGYNLPTATAITPALGTTNSTVPITLLSGTWITKGSTFCLRSGATTIVVATNVQWNGKIKIAGDLDLTGVAAGFYDVVVKRPDGAEATITNGFEVEGSVPVFIQAFAAEAQGDGVNLKWELYADEPIREFRVLRGHDGGATQPLATLRAGDARSYVDRSVKRGTQYDYQLVVVLGDGSEILSQRSSAMLNAFVAGLGQNKPNPFNPTTEISYSVPDGASAHVSLVIYDVTGAKVRTLVNNTKPAGLFSETWDGRDDQGNLVRSGVYFYRLAQPGFTQTKKMVLLK